jgi:hypothetical protein
VTRKKLRLAGFSGGEAKREDDEREEEEADDGTRTHDLLHGKQTL